ncbi:MAG: SDR family NAD(P)-dependent oxidoreductase [Actinomycetota bacterium]|jgi:3-oxoacyl-[acyl-carrier protein] reductase|nr:SDR family NAD(P)-dependent oxidoreductase [Actinomycetota bacterium]MDA8315825.1 SDR family NAD(P)-dependent oxidoreductase [Actinomycetota bacterium]
MSTQAASRPQRRLVAVVTGGMSGIGAATVERLRTEGLAVLTMDRAAGADLSVDVSSAEEVRAALGDVGDVDVLVNSAGIAGPNKPLWDVTPEEWDRTFAVNVSGTFNTCRVLAPGMRSRGWGRIINVASIAGKEGNPNLSAYSASKAAVIALTKSLGKELATSGVLVNVVAPAVIDTPMNAATDAAVLDYMVQRIPMGRTGKPEEVAELIAWLSSDLCSFSTGAVYDVSGGRATY